MHEQLTARLNRDLQREAGISLADYDVLVNLSEAPAGRLRAFELCRVLEWEKSRLSHHVGRMHGRGLVVREECPGDARGAYLALTDAGKHALEVATALHVSAVHRYFLDALTGPQLRALGDIAEAVLACLQVGTSPVDAPPHAEGLGQWQAAGPAGS